MSDPLPTWMIIVGILVALPLYCFLDDFLKGTRK